jgi:hypothetical protein
MAAVAKAQWDGDEAAVDGEKFHRSNFSRTRSSRKNKRAVEESLLVVLVLETFWLLRGEWRVGRSRLGVKIRG